MVPRRDDRQYSVWSWSLSYVASRGINRYRRDIITPRYPVHGSADYPQTGLSSAVCYVGSPLGVWECTLNWAGGVELGYHAPEKGDKKVSGANDDRDEGF
jgi:hypothetical protein